MHRSDTSRTTHYAVVTRSRRLVNARKAADPAKSAGRLHGGGAPVDLGGDGRRTPLHSAEFTLPW